MARKPRIKVAGHAAVYHVVNRVNHKRHKLDKYMKKYFIELLAKLKKLYFVRYAAFTILNNHYHLLLNFHDPEDVDTGEALKRWNDYHAGTPFTRNASLKADREYVIRELTDVSSFMKRFNAHMTQRYNWKNGTVGTLWERRFRSSVMERGCAQALCSTYIDLNAFRASLVTNPEEYEFSSLFELKKGNTRDLVDTDLLAESLFLNPDSQDLYPAYLAYIYKAGARPADTDKPALTLTTKMVQFLKKHGLDIEKGILARRQRTLIESKGTGGEQFTEFLYEAHLNPGYLGPFRDIHKARWLIAIFKRLPILSLCSTHMRGSP